MAISVTVGALVPKLAPIIVACVTAELNHALWIVGVTV